MPTGMWSEKQHPVLSTERKWIRKRKDNGSVSNEKRELVHLLVTYVFICRRTGVNRKGRLRLRRLAGRV